ncbi:DNA-directed RNA polymerase subunit omega [Peptococcaceae bacterium CEB3]|nr:DNA-directed RNA polymerase subunit omega [Peptococcaceae bacterium CEB3]
MKQPSLDILMQKVDSKYSLVVAAAKRARMLMENPEQEELAKGVKAVSVALEEIAEGKLILENPREEVK